MKKKIDIQFDAERLPGDASAILVPLGCGPDVASVHDYTVLNYRRVTVNLQLDDGDDRIAKVLGLLEKYGERADVSSYTEYSNEDLQSARLLLMWRDTNENVSSGLMKGTRYDMSAACANCGTGARQTSALYVDGDSEGRAMIRKHRAIGTWDGDILVDGGMVKKLKDAGVTGISFGEVRARLQPKKWSMVAREQILIEHVMPPMRSELTEDDKKYLCQVCRRGGRMAFPDGAYRAEDLVGMQDLNVTWEWFGEFWPEKKPRHAKRPSPHTLVTPKVMNIFRDAGVTTFEWIPVLLQE